MPKSKTEKIAATPAFIANLSPEADQFLSTAMELFNERQRALRKEWQFDSYKQWGFDQLSGTFRIEFEDGRQLHADGQILGSYSSSGQSWEWGWHNPYVDPAIARDSRAVKELGGRFGLDYLTSGTVPVPDEQFISFLCAVGLKATDSAGVFRGSAGPIEVMILLKNLRAVEKAAKVSRKKAA